MPCTVRPAYFISDDRRAIAKLHNFLRAHHARPSVVKQVVILQLRDCHPCVDAVLEDFVHNTGKGVFHQDIEQTAQHIACFLGRVFGHRPPENVVVIVETIFTVWSITHPNGSYRRVLISSVNGLWPMSNTLPWSEKSVANSLYADITPSSDENLSVISPSKLLRGMNESSWEDIE